MSGLQQTLTTNRLTAGLERVFEAPVEQLNCTAYESRLYSGIYSVDATIGGRLRPLVVKTWSNASSYRFQIDAIEAASRAFEGDAGVHIPFLGCDAIHQMLVMERIYDPSIESLAHCELELQALNLLRWKRRLVRACCSAGHWLEKWHSLDTRQADLGQLLGAYLYGRAGDLDLLDRADRKALIALVDRLGSGNVCPVHGDFTPWNVLWRPERIAVLDFGVGEWGRMSPAWDYQTMRIGIASELLFATRSPARWLKRLAHAPLHAFDRGYAGVQCGPAAMNACAAVRHLNLYAADIRDSKAVRKRADWHLASIQRILGDPCSPDHRIVGLG